MTIIITFAFQAFILMVLYEKLQRGQIPKRALLSETLTHQGSKAAHHEIEIASILVVVVVVNNI